MSDIFISYSNHDKKNASILVGILESYGFSVWWDTSLLAGSVFSKEIESELKKAKCVIVIWSKKSIKSQWVLAEAAYALQRNVLLPTLLGSVEPPLPFNQLHTSNISSTISKNKGLPTELILALEKITSKKIKKEDNKKIEPYISKKIKYAATIITISLIYIVLSNINNKNIDSHKLFLEDSNTHEKYKKFMDELVMNVHEIESIVERIYKLNNKLNYSKDDYQEAKHLMHKFEKFYNDSREILEKLQIYSNLIKYCDNENIYCGSIDIKRTNSEVKSYSEELNNILKFYLSLRRIYKKI